MRGLGAGHPRAHRVSEGAGVPVVGTVCSSSLRSGHDGSELLETNHTRRMEMGGEAPMLRRLSPSLFPPGRVIEHGRAVAAVERYLVLQVEV